MCVCVWKVFWASVLITFLFRLFSHFNILYVRALDERLLFISTFAPFLDASITLHLKYDYLNAPRKKTLKLIWLNTQFDSTNKKNPSRSNSDQNRDYIIWFRYYFIGSYSVTQNKKKYLDRIVIMPWTLSIWNHFVNKKLFWTQQHPKWFQVGFDGYWFQGKTYKSSFVYRSYNAFFALSRWWFELIATNQLKICFQTASIRYYVPNIAENVLSRVKKHAVLKKVVSLFSVDSFFNVHLLIKFI